MLLALATPADVREILIKLLDRVLVMSDNEETAKRKGKRRK